MAAPLSAVPTPPPTVAKRRPDELRDRDEVPNDQEGRWDAALKKRSGHCHAERKNEDAHREDGSGVLSIEEPARFHGSDARTWAVTTARSCRAPRACVIPPRRDFAPDEDRAIRSKCVRTGGRRVRYWLDRATFVQGGFRGPQNGSRLNGRDGATVKGVTHHADERHPLV